MNGSILIDLLKLMGNNKYLESLNEKDLINRFGKEININDTDIINNLKKIQSNSADENSKFIKTVLDSFKKMEENENIRFISCTYFCFSIYIINLLIREQKERYQQ